MYRVLLNNSKLPKEAVITIGNFDGFHYGHLELLKSQDKIAKDKNYRRVVITFEPLPLEYFKKINLEKPIARLSLLRDKVFFLKKYQLTDELIILKFNPFLADLGPEDFIQLILKDKLNVKHIVIGHDFKFGKDRSGNVNDFVKNGITVTEVAPFYIDEKRVSSSIIREYASNNDLKNVYKYLGHNLQYTSHIMHGNKLGRKYGIPTINLSISRYYPALHGIYIARVYIEGVAYNAVASVGRHPTVSERNDFKLEAHLLNVDLNLYGKIATVEFLSFLRTEIKFSDEKELFKQINLDIKQTKEYFYKIP